MPIPILEIAEIAGIVISFLPQQDWRKRRLTEIQIERIPGAEDVPLPSQAHPGEDVGYDLHYTGKRVTIWPFTKKTLPVNCKMAMPKGFCGHVRGRSGLTKKGMLTPGGTVDPGFRGCISVTLCNFSVVPRVFHRGDRIAQLVFHRYEEVQWEQVSKIPDNSARGEKGFGSTGIKQIRKKIFSGGNVVGRP
jgi:dUTP pyrophosphatase